MWIYVERIYMSEEQYAVSVEKKIGEIKNGDLKVRFLGVVVEKGDGYIIVEDNTGRARVYTDEGGLKVKDIVYVIGTILQVIQDEPEISSEAIAVMNGIDLSLYDQVLDLKRRVKKNP